MSQPANIQNIQDFRSVRGWTSEIGHNSNEVFFDLGPDGLGVEITPEAARMILESSRKPYKVDKEAVKAYAAAMSSGAWSMNGMPIILSQDGDILDGHQRLEACIASGESFRTLIARNVREDTLHTIDQHRQRNYPNILESRGYSHAGALTRTIIKLIRIQDGMLGRADAPLSWSRMDRMLRENDDLLVKSVSLSRRFSGSSLPGPIRPTFIFMAIAAGHEDEVISFLRIMEDSGLSVMDSTSGSGSGAPRILSMQLSVAREHGYISPDTALALAILSFRDFLDKRSPKSHYKWEPDYGSVKVGSDGKPLSKKALREDAPRNIGLPEMPDYPGLKGSEALEGDVRTANARWHGALPIGSQHEGKSDRKTSVEIISVTPSLAQEWLDRFNVKNRKVQESHAMSISRDIAGGKWQQNAQPICFAGDPRVDSDARLLNGQHRLRGLVLAAKRSDDDSIEIEIPIAVNIPPDAFPTFDIHRKKSAVKNSSVDPRAVSAAARFFWEKDNDYTVGSRIVPSSSELIEASEQHPGITNPDHFSTARRLKSFGSSGVLLYFIARMYEERADLAPDFLSAFEFGEGLEKGDPIAPGRTDILKNREKRNRRQTIEALLKIWDKWLKYKGEPVYKDSNQDELDLKS